MRRPLASWSVLWVAALAAVPLNVHAQSTTTTRVPAVAAFDGKSWGGMTLGVTRDQDIKRIFNTVRSPIRPEAVRLRLGEDADSRVDVLLDGRGGQAKASAFRVEFIRNAPNIQDLATLWSETPQTYFAETRYEDWSVVAFLNRGVAFFVMGSEERMRPVFAVLTTPDNVKLLLQGLEDTPTEIEPYNPRIDPEDLIIQYDRVSVDLSTTGVDVRDRLRIQDDLAYDLERRLRASFLEYRRGGDGNLSGRVTARWDSRRQTLTIEVVLSASGNNLLGSVSASGSGEDRYTRVSERPLLRDDRLLRRAFDEAMRNLEDNFDAAVRRQRPPTREEIRNAEWLRRVNDATRRV